MKLRVKKNFIYNGDQSNVQNPIMFKQDEIITETRILANMYLEAKSNADGKLHLISQFTNHPNDDQRFVEYFEILVEEEEDEIS